MFCTVQGRYICAAPTYNQAKRIFWSDLKEMIPDWALRAQNREKDISESELQISLFNGATITVMGMEKPERVEGPPLRGIVLDEYANIKKKAWDDHVRPALSTKNHEGWAWLIGVPEGRNHYYDLWKYAISGVDPEWAGFHWISSEILDAKEIESARRTMDPATFRQEYEASFETFAGRVYYPFNEAEHATESWMKWNKVLPLHVCFDFNVKPGTASLIQTLPYQGELKNAAQEMDAQIGEVWIRDHSNTEKVCARIIQDYGSHKGDVVCFGDASGGARKSSATNGSDWEIIYRELRAHFGSRAKMRVKTSNPTERSRVNALNSQLKTSNDLVRFQIHPKCVYSIKDLEGVRVLEGSAGEIDKKYDPSLTHLSDGIGYRAEYLYPVRGGKRFRVREF